MFTGYSLFLYTIMGVLSIGTFNVRGLNDDQKKLNLALDMKKYNVDICCLQETKISKGSDINIGKDLVTINIMVLDLQ